MGEAANLKTAPGGKRTALYLFLLILIAVIIVGAIIGLIASNIDLAANILLIVLIVIVGIVLVGAAVYLIILLVAAPYYVMKGEQYQDNISYDLKDVKPVKESSSEDKKE